MIDALGQFLQVVELGSVSAAARRVHLSQPALSAAIVRVEQYFGAQLLVRTRRGVEPTAAGEVAVAHVRSLLASLGDAQRAVAEVVGLKAGEVRIGAGATACTYVLPRYLAKFRERAPGVRLKLREATTEELLGDLESGGLDLAVLASEVGVTMPGEPWCDDEVLLVAAPGGTRDVFVTFPPGASTRGLLDKHFAGAEVAMELSSIASVKGHVRAGIGMALVSRVAVERDLRQGAMVRVRDPRVPIVRRFWLSHRGLARLSPAALALRELLLAQPPQLRAATRGAKAKSRSRL